jgi:uncharacterized membrane protein
MRFKTKADAESIQMLARCVQELEARTEAEVVLVLRRSSGNYRDVDYLAGALLAFAVLLFKLFSPWEFDPLSVPLPILLAFAVGARLSHSLGRYGPRRYLTTSRRRSLQVRHAAAGCYRDKNIDRAPSRAGILLYFSALEQRAELLADERARHAIAPKLEELRARLQETCSSSRTVSGSIAGLAEFLRSLGLYLGQVLPCDPAAGPCHALDDTPDVGDEEL